jgi:hypothetical protein
MTLAEQHRLQQLALRAITIRQILRVWPMFDENDIAGSWPAVQEALTALIWLRHSQSAALAANYYRAARYNAGIVGDAPIQLAEAPPLEQIDTSLGFVGRFMPMKQAALGRQNVADVALVAVTGAATRLVLQGGRDTLTDTIQSDQHARGYERVTSGNSCEFCEVLAGRGAVYGEESADFAAHDHCSCSAEPVFESGERGEGRQARAYTPSARQISPEQRSIRNERLREFIANR